MKSFAPLLAYKWTKANNTYEVYGKWAEDGSEYKFTVPVQLVSPIVAMQNYVFDMYKEISDRENTIVQLQKELDEYKKARGYFG